MNCPLYYAQRLLLRNTVTRSSQFRFETLLYGDDNLDYESNVAIILAVHEFIKDSERFWLWMLYVYSFIITSYWLYIPCEIYYAWECLLLDSCDCWIVFTCPQNVWCYTGDTCVSVLCECVYDWLSMLVQLYMLCRRGLQHSICALPNSLSCKWSKICLKQEIKSVRNVKAQGPKPT